MIKKCDCNKEMLLSKDETNPYLIKYLDDGRKVVVMSKLNMDEVIVQEIFINDAGEEIPSGRNFVVNNLHDEPVKSYIEVQLKKAEQSLDLVERKVKEIGEKRKAAEEELRLLQKLINSTKNLNFMLGKKKLEIFSMFVTGLVNYLVVEDYGTIKPPVKMIDAVTTKDFHRRCNFSPLKLVSVLGRSDGDFEYRIHEYSDGSGSYKKVFPFIKEADAINHIRERAIRKIEEDHLDLESYTACMNMGISFSPEQKTKFLNKIQKENLKRIQMLENEIAQKKAKLDIILSEVPPSL